MPTYTYQCDQCKDQKEIKQRITEDELKACPVCQSEQFYRVISGGTGFLLKGGGWYSDGYSGGSSSADSSASSTASSAPSGHSCGSSCACD